MTGIPAYGVASEAALLAALRKLPTLRTLTLDELEPANFTGMAHDHIRLKGKGLILRVPRVSQWGLPAEVNLAYQSACFSRAEASGLTPRLFAVLPPGPALAMGALVVQEIPGARENQRISPEETRVARAMKARPSQWGKPLRSCRGARPSTCLSFQRTG